MPLCIHGEVTDANVDVFDREAVFIDGAGAAAAPDPAAAGGVRAHHHAEAVHFVAEARADNVAATITPQHLHINRNAMLVGGIRPHAYCLPVAKREKHRLALRKAATSAAIPSSSSAPTARPMPARPRKAPAAAPASSTRPMRWRAT
jgi:dihydroorotase